MDVSGLSINLEVEEVERQIMQQQQQRRGSANIISSGGPSSAEMAVEMHRQIVEQLESTVSNLPSGSTGVINIEVSKFYLFSYFTTTYISLLIECKWVEWEQLEMSVFLSIHEASVDPKIP